LIRRGRGTNVEHIHLHLRLGGRWIGGLLSNGGRCKNQAAQGESKDSEHGAILNEKCENLKSQGTRMKPG
jgi:hypothetical protein